MMRRGAAEKLVQGSESRRRDTSRDHGSLFENFSSDPFTAGRRRWRTHQGRVASSAEHASDRRRIVLLREVERLGQTRVACRLRIISGRSPAWDLVRAVALEQRWKNTYQRGGKKP